MGGAQETRERKFKIGDRVKVNLISLGNEEWRGKKGTVVDFKDDGDLVGIDFDEKGIGHTLDGKCKDGHGWWMEPKHFNKIGTGNIRDELKSSPFGWSSYMGASEPIPERVERLEVGDRIQNIDMTKGICNANRHKFGTVVKSDSVFNHYNIKYDDGSLGMGGSESYKKITKNKKTFMNKVSVMMKKLLDARTQKFVKAGFINGDLDITSEGVEALNRIAFFEKGVELEAEADARIAEMEKNKEE